MHFSCYESLYLLFIKNKELNEEIAKFLESHGFKVYLPQRDTPQSEDMATVFGANVNGIKTSEVVVAVLINYGRDLGFEVGYAYALGKPIVGYTDNDKFLEDKMIAGAIADVARNLEELIDKLKKYS